MRRKIRSIGGNPLALKGSVHPETRGNMSRTMPSVLVPRLKKYPVAPPMSTMASNERARMEFMSLSRRMPLLSGLRMLPSVMTVNIPSTPR